MSTTDHDNDARLGELKALALSRRHLHEDRAMHEWERLFGEDLDEDPSSVAKRAWKAADAFMVEWDARYWTEVKP